MRAREQADQHRRAGFRPDLIFAWWVRRRDGVGRTAVAVLVVGLGFAGMSALLAVTGRPVRDEGLKQPAAGVVILRGDDPASRDLIEWAREHSPDAVRWEPRPGAAVAEVMLEVENELRSASRYQPRLQPEAEREPLPDEDPVVELVGPRLPRVEVPADDPPLAAEVAVAPVFTPSPDLAARWQDPGGEWPAEFLRGLEGRRVAYSVGVAPGGAVEFCLPLGEADPSLNEELQQHLRGVTLKPVDGDGLQWGVVRVRIEAGDGEEAEP